MQKSIITEVEYLANKAATSEDVKDMEVAAILFTVLGAYYSGTTKNLLSLTSTFSAQAINDIIAKHN